MEAPARKPEGEALTARQKRRTRRRRVVAGHGVGTVKVWRVAADRSRNPPRRHTRMFKDVAGPHDRMFAE